MTGRNRLADETSPYLRQHADNPVDWYPWGEEAFKRAKAEDRLILLSIGYSACHWCHVMAHESFEDESIAALMNDLFVCVKVDREERPDVDAVYMEAVQALTGHGGWPLTVFLTPSHQPFFGGTYYPPVQRGGMPGFRDVLLAVNEAWLKQRPELLERASQLTEAIEARTEIQGGEAWAITTALPVAAVAALANAFDEHWGGFGKAPKFPMPANLDLLLRRLAHGRDETIEAMVSTTLDAMASGGIYDHVGGGFSRYSVDAFWMVPHFEKMLYDNALLARVYLNAHLLLGRETWGQVAEETIEYVLRDLGAPEGGFYSAEDADSEGEEGLFYTWRIEELEEHAPEAIAWYGATRAGNFEARNILHRPERGDLLRPPEIEAARKRLFDVRSQRVRPGLDDKVITEWNAMFVGTLANAAFALDRPDWLARAEACGAFLVEHLRREDGRWMRSWQRDGGARHLAYAIDYAWVIDGFTRLAEASGQARWVTVATETADAMIELFFDEENGGLFTVGSDAPQLIVRQKDLFDGATPATNSVAAQALLRLASYSGQPRYAAFAEVLLALISEAAKRVPTAFAWAMGAVDLLVSGSTEVVVAGDRPDLLAVVRGRYLPTTVVAWAERFDSPLWRGRADGLAYLCRSFACGLPASTPDELRRQLDPPPPDDDF